MDANGPKNKICCDKNTPGFLAHSGLDLHITPASRGDLVCALLRENGRGATAQKVHKLRRPAKGRRPGALLTGLVMAGALRTTYLHFANHSVAGHCPKFTGKEYRTFPNQSLSYWHSAKLQRTTLFWQTQANTLGTKLFAYQLAISKKLNAILGTKVLVTTKI
ncbi:hypothetical protein [Microbulbifer sp. PSTR4-B]|uniref:hypothetical protein n=1 Tax=Microbulbifer sp. PSTR4-B TaxID=3243396 RepID=UPI004039147C